MRERVERMSPNSIGALHHAALQTNHAALHAREDMGGDV